MSSPRFEPALQPAQFSSTPQGNGRAEDWIGRWAEGPNASVLVNIAGLNAAKREYDITVRERLPSKSVTLLRHTFVQIYESHVSTPAPMEKVRTLLLPEHGILLGLYRLLPEPSAQWPMSPRLLIRYRRPPMGRAAAVDVMLRQTPRVG